MLGQLQADLAAKEAEKTVKQSERDKLDEIKNAIEELIAQFSSISKELRDVILFLTSANKYLKISGDINGQQYDDGKISGFSSQLSNNQSEVDVHIGDLEAIIREVEGDITKLDDAISKLNEQIHELKVAIAQLWAETMNQVRYGQQDSK